MGRGYPDFFGIPIFPNYGPFTVDDSDAVNCPAGAKTTILTIAGKGRSYGGWISWISVENIFQGSYIVFEIDGATIISTSPYWDLYFGHDRDDHRIARLNGYIYNETSYVVRYSIVRDFTWGESLVISLRNNTAVAFSGYATLYWSKVLTA